MIITWPTNTGDITDQIRNAIGRNIQIYFPVSGIACAYSGCFYDPSTGLSTNPFCPACNGKYWINSVAYVEMLAHVTMKGSDIPVWTVGGYIVDGDAIAQVKYTTSGYDTILNASYVIVDSKKYLIKNNSLRGVPSPNRVVMILEQQEG